MAAFRIKLYGLTHIDKTSLKSMLKLASDLLTHEWQVIEKGKADLSIYSFDTEEGLTAWQQHGDGLTALLTATGNITEPVDIILKKPLRTTNFSDALNIIEDKITTPPQLKKVSTSTQSVKKEPEQTNKTKKNSFLSSLSSGISKYISGKIKPASHLPPLSLQIPEQTATNTNTITDTRLLQNWLAGLNYDDNNYVVPMLLGNLVPLNRLTLSNKVRLELLEVYRTVIHKILFSRDIAAIKRDLYATAEHLKVIQTLSLAIEELAIGYKVIVNQLYINGEKPDSNKLFLTAINRTAEQLSLQTLHAFQYYRSPPISALHELHQLYLYNETSDTLDLQTTAKGLPNTASFFSLYIQVLLTSIADPYSLEKFDVLRLFKLMGKFTEQVEVSLLSDKQIKATSDFLMTGHFCLDFTSDHPPTPMAKTATDIRKQPHTRLLNTQPVLLAIEKIFKQAAHSNGKSAFDLDIQLLKKIIPQLNTSYERRYQRLPSVHDRQINIADGVNNIHRCLIGGHINDTPEWVMSNQSSAGIMASKESEGSYDLHIGDFMGIFEPDLPVKLASIRWLNIDNDGYSHIGLELHPGHPLPVSCLSSDNNKEYNALLLPKDEDLKQPATLISEKGLFSPKRQLKIKGDDEPYSISIDALIDHTFNSEQFSFTVIPTE
jgi:hypothetical protein